MTIPIYNIYFIRANSEYELITCDNYIKIHEDAIPSSSNSSDKCGSHTIENNIFCISIKYLLENITG